VLLLLVALLLLPTLVERIMYSFARGKQRAEAEVARELLTHVGEDGAKGGFPVTIAAYRYVAKAVEPSVVGVKATQIVGQGPVDELSALLYGRRFRRQQQQDQGSGVIVDEAGYVITNNHVVGESSDISVELSDGSHHKATLVGADPATDLAVLQINASGLTAAPWGDTESLEVGDPVLAIGNPFGLARTVTSGIISAKGRRAIVPGVDYQNFIQTDAAVNPGNSGGPLVNMKGEVVGINTAIVGPAYQGISFAIPSSLAKEVYEKLRSTGTVARGWLGVGTDELTPEYAKQLGLEATSGAMVTQVMRGSPAAMAGIRKGDIIVAWNDKPIRDPTELGWAVASTPIGSKANVMVIRNGAKQPESLTVTVGERPRLK
jgi:serine protease Do